MCMHWARVVKRVVKTNERRTINRLEGNKHENRPEYNSD